MSLHWRTFASVDLIRVLLRLDDRVPGGVGSRRARRWRTRFVVAVVLLSPGSYLAFHVERAQPLIDRVAEQPTERAVRNGP